jgi:hypothetical protein
VTEYLIDAILFKSSKNRFDFSSLRITKKEKAALAIAFFFLIPERLRTTKGVRTKRSDLMSGLVCLPVGSE